MEALPEEVVKACLVPENDIGKYVLLGQIGEGGMSSVYKAWDKNLRRFVAIKFLKNFKPDDLARFRREGEILAKLRHQNIAHIYDLYADVNTAYIAMEYIDGVPLLKIKKDVKDTISYFDQVAQALEYCHSQGVIHRDIGPKNIIIDKNNNAFLVDFGIAKLSSGGSTVTGTDTVVGTPSYMSPEQCRGDELGPQTDIYSLGATMYYVATKSPPFEADKPVKVLYKVMYEEAVPPRVLNPTVHKDIERIIMKCMAKKPDQRYATMTELRADLHRYINGKRVLARPPMRKKERTFFVAAGVILLAILIVGLGIYFRMNRSNIAEKMAEVRKLANAAMASAPWNPQRVNFVNKTRDAISEIRSMRGVDSQTMLDCAETLMQIGEKDAAMEILNELVSRKNEPKARILRARVFIDEYLTSYAVAMSGVGSDTELLMKQWQSKIKVSSLLASIDDVRSFLQNSGEGVEAERHFAEGLLAMYGKRYTAAIENFSKSSSSPSVMPEADILKSICYLMSNNPDKSFQTIKSVQTDISRQFKIVFLLFVLTYEKFLQLKVRQSPNDFLLPLARNLAIVLASEKERWSYYTPKITKYWEERIDKLPGQ